ncbi:hypothetical protein [Saccharopolyspora spinosa]|uniref:hypothetical protein n=1 Tax=Saccharopolyspora spinosa TaxID=60894 RepID=UPI003B430B32
MLEELEGQGPLTVEQAAELAEFQSKVARWKQQQKEKNAKRYQKRKAVAGRVVVLEELAGQGELTVEQEAELAELQPKVAQQKQQKTEDDARYHRAIRAVADRVEELEELAGQGELTEEQEAELAELQPSGTSGDGGVAVQWFWVAQPGLGIRVAHRGGGAEASARCVRVGGRENRPERHEEDTGGDR